MIDAKEATRIAATYLGELYDTVDVHSIRLEELELVEDERHWLITLSFQEQDASPQWISFGMGRHYKVFKIEAETGKVRSMKIRQLERA